jgi:ribonucleoside-diphosphate reductase alpha chain
VFRRLALDYLPEETREGLGIKSIAERKEAVALEAGTAPAAPDAPATEAEGPSMPRLIDVTERPNARSLDAPLCYQCGSKMQPAGSCYVCGSCGSTSGCS